MIWLELPFAKFYHSIEWVGPRFALACQRSVKVVVFMALEVVSLLLCPEATRGTIHQDFVSLGAGHPASLSCSRSHDARMLQCEKEFHEAAKRNDVDEMEKLLKKVKVDAKNMRDQTALHFAAGSGQEDAVKLLLERKANVDKGDKYGMNPLLIAAWFGHLEVLKRLVNGGGRVSSQNKNGLNILHCAAQRGHVETVKYTLESLEDLGIEGKTNAEKTPYLLAAEYGQLAVLELLMDYKCAQDVSDGEKNTAIHLAAKSGHMLSLEHLLEKGPGRTLDFVNSQNANGNTALHLAAEGGHLECVRMLLDCEAICDINALNNESMNALHMAAKHGHEQIAKLLIDETIDINAISTKQASPLHLAVQNNYPIIVTFLVEAEANINLVDCRNQTALHIAAETGFQESADLLLAAGTDLTLLDKQKKSCLEVAARANQVNLVDMIIKADRYFTRRKQEEGNEESVLGAVTFRPDRRAETQHLRSVLWDLARDKLRPEEWQQLATHWKFTEAQIQAIQQQWEGKKTYKEHAHRMLLVWLHGVLEFNENPIKALYEGLVGIGRRDLADLMRRKAHEEHVAGKKCTVS
uniref:Ankyrin repeat and death domain-containing protein 1A-like isoform X1 n=1 Tax=Petromyzon marinus TaxID=7757 RepID=A0AAJ7X8S1_PETMA|nr:ankyrin repeat and death domain-containing protein 1A-like isoform X1 [Petromyzon marinus]